MCRFGSSTSLFSYSLIWTRAKNAFGDYRFGVQTCGHVCLPVRAPRRSPAECHRPTAAPTPQADCSRDGPPALSDPATRGKPIRTPNHYRSLFVERFRLSLDRTILTRIRFFSTVIAAYLATFGSTGDRSVHTKIALSYGMSAVTRTRPKNVAPGSSRESCRLSRPANSVRVLLNLYVTPMPADG